MNEELQGALVAILEKATMGVDFAVEQTPDVVQQLLTYRMAVSFVWCTISVVLLVAGAYLFYRGFKYATTENEPDFFPPLCIGSVITLITVCCMWDTTWVKIWLAPKIFILEYAASLAN